MVMMEKQDGRRTHKDEFVKATEIKTNEVVFYKNGMDASIGIDCTPTLAYKALKSREFSAKGWRLEYISKDDPQCVAFRKQIDDRVRSQRQSRVKHAKDEVQKRMSFVKEAKAQRKAEHDEIMKVLRGMLANAIASLKSQLEQEAEDYRYSFANYHAIVQYTMDGKKVREWDSAYQAQKETNIKNIRQVVLGLRESAGGFKWEFLI